MATSPSKTLQPTTTVSANADTIQE